MSDRLKSILLIILCTLVVSGIVFVTGVFVLSLSVEVSILFTVLGAGAFLYLVFREQEAPPLEMHQSTWNASEETIEKEN